MAKLIWWVLGKFSLLGCHSGGLNQRQLHHWIGLLDWLYDPHLFQFMPAADVSAPAPWFRPADELINLGTLLTNGDGRSVVSLSWCQGFDAPVTVPLVVPVDKRGNPLTVLLFGGIRLTV